MILIKYVFDLYYLQLVITILIHRVNVKEAEDEESVSTVIFARFIASVNDTMKV